MSAPSNDNLANAIALPQSGSGWYNNLNSTTEASDPKPNFGHTVWFTWTQASPTGLQDEMLFIDTRQPDNIPPGNTPYLNTTVRVFTSGMQEMSYIVAGNTQYGQTSLSRGSYVVIYPNPQQIVYIRVDGVPEGWFFLQWGLSKGLQNIGKCGNCTNSIGINTTCIATFKGPTNLVLDGPDNPVAQQTATAPAGTYMLRYCSGYYTATDNTGAYHAFVPNIFGGPSFDAQGIGTFMALFRNNDPASGLTLNPIFGSVDPQPSSPHAGDCYITSQGDFTPGCEYWDGAQWQTPNSWIGTLVAAGGPPPPTNTNTGTAEPWYNNIFALFSTQACNSFIFAHTGGNITWLFAINGDPVTTLLNPGGAIPQLGPSYFVGPSGPPTYQLVRINARLALVSVALTFDNSFGNDTANGQKNAVLSLVIRNPDQFTWNNVTATAAGFFTVQDPAYYPGEPTVLNFSPSANQNYSKRFVMIANGNVGQFTLSFADGVQDTFFTFDSPSNSYKAQPLTINVTPAFGSASSAPTGIGFTYQGIKAHAFRTSISNIGNATTINAAIKVSVTVAGQTIQIAGVDDNNNQTNWANSFTYKPFFGSADAVLNPSGHGLAWEPNSQVTFNIFLPTTGAIQNAIVTIAVTDGSAFPSIQVPIQIPAS